MLPPKPETYVIRSLRRKQVSTSFSGSMKKLSKPYFKFIVSLYGYVIETIIIIQFAPYMHPDSFDSSGIFYVTH
ncbi:hypothetical protein Ldro_0186 [Legionella drozanskii LLAP-1]|uniref:Uncharacterized protein n=1 Tax=Legionella drozanskii LLAP-1 TaxID=1212489 RepID=A0A0W0TE03_9GAMM|nr:hypothetical protein Ldro_0186 [Legionella drozanskii LLAP-1]